MDTLIMYPSMGMSHLVPMVEFAKLILTHHPCSSFSITILVTPQPPTSSTTTAAATTYIEQISTTLPPNITFHHLPNPSSPRAHLSTHDLTQVRQTLESLSNSTIIKALVIDFFMTRCLEVSKPLNIPTFCFFPSGASPLAALLYLPTIHESIQGNLKDLEICINIPGLPPVPASDMPLPMLDRSSKAYENVLYVARKLPECSGIIRNTFDALEERVIRAIRNGDCLPGNNGTPPLFCLGPLLTSASESGGCSGGDGSRHFCMEWLDSQPSRSVVFLCFGTVVPFSADQLREIAVALDSIVASAGGGDDDDGCLCKFLWVVRLPSNCSSLDDILPQGFLERNINKNKGLVVTSWVPQSEILCHESVGCYVNHCGWNSVLEAVCGGVPMVAWPSNNAENKLNRLFMVEEVKLALGIKESRDGFVSAHELKERVKEVMSPEIQSGFRERIGVMSECAKRAWQEEDGSSRVALRELVDLWKTK